MDDSTRSQLQSIQFSPEHVDVLRIQSLSLDPSLISELTALYPSIINTKPSFPPTQSQCDTDPRQQQQRGSTTSVAGNTSNNPIANNAIAEPQKHTKNQPTSFDSKAYFERQIVDIVLQNANRRRNLSAAELFTFNKKVKDGLKQGGIGEKIMEKLAEAQKQIQQKAFAVLGDGAPPSRVGSSQEWQQSPQQSHHQVNGTNGVPSTSTARPRTPVNGVVSRPSSNSNLASPQKAIPKAPKAMVVDQAMKAIESFLSNGITPALGAALSTTVPAPPTSTPSGSSEHPHYNGISPGTMNGVGANQRIGIQSPIGASGIGPTAKQDAYETLRVLLAPASVGTHPASGPAPVPEGISIPLDPEFFPHAPLASSSRNAQEYSQSNPKSDVRNGRRISRTPPRRGSGMRSISPQRKRNVPIASPARRMSMRGNTPSPVRKGRRLASPASRVMSMRKSPSPHGPKLHSERRAPMKPKRSPSPTAYRLRSPPPAARRPQSPSPRIYRKRSPSPIWRMRSPVVSHRRRSPDSRSCHYRSPSPRAVSPPSTRGGARILRGRSLHRSPSPIIVDRTYKRILKRSRSPDYLAILAKDVDMPSAADEKRRDSSLSRRKRPRVDSDATEQDWKRVKIETESIRSLRSPSRSSDDSVTLLPTVRRHVLPASSTYRQPSPPRRGRPTMPRAMGMHHAMPRSSSITSKISSRTSPRRSVSPRGRPRRYDVPPPRPTSPDQHARAPASASAAVRSPVLATSKPSQPVLPLPPPPPPPRYQCPGLWFAKVGADSLRVLRIPLDVDEQTSSRWNMYPPVDDVSQFKRPKLRLNLVCLPTQEVEAKQKTIAKPTPTAIVEALRTIQIKWPQKGQLIIEVNRGKAWGKTWLPFQLNERPEAPVDLTDHLRLGANEITLIQLDDLRHCTFLLVANTYIPAAPSAAIINAPITIISEDAPLEDDKYHDLDKYLLQQEFRLRNAPNSDDEEGEITGAEAAKGLAVVSDPEPEEGQISPIVSEDGEIPGANGKETSSTKLFSSPSMQEVTNSGVLTT